MSQRPVNPGNHPSKGLQECNEIGPQANLNSDPAPQECPKEAFPDASLRDVDADRPDLGWLEDAANKKIGIGARSDCDPMQTGQIVEDIHRPNRDVLYRYSKSIRGADEAIQDLFKGLVVLDEEGKAHTVPIVWGTQERAVAWILQDNTRKDGSLVVDRIRLPMLAVHSTDIAFDQSRYIYHGALDYMRTLRPDRKPGFTVKERYERDTVFGVTRGLPVNITYTLFAWTLYMEDMGQLLEQVISKFSPVAYINVRGVQWETIVTLDSIANNVDYEPGDQNLRVIKYQFTMTAQTFIPQPIVRKKAVLKTKTDIYNSVEPEKITEVLGRLEEAVKELEE